MEKPRRVVLSASFMSLGLLLAGCPDGSSPPPPPPTWLPPEQAQAFAAPTEIPEVQKPLFVSAILATREARVSSSRIDAVNSRLEAALELQDLGAGGPAPLEGTGRVVLTDASELYGDVQTTHTIDPASGAPFPLSPDGFLTGVDRLASGAVVTSASVVRGRVEIGQGTLFVEGAPSPARVTETATTRGVVESGLLAGEGFQPQVGGVYAGGQIGEGSVLGVDRLEKTADDPPFELEKTPVQLRNELRVLAASRGAATLEPGPDGELGTDDDVFSPLRFEAPFEIALPDPAAGGTDHRDTDTAEILEGTLRGSITLDASGSPYFFRHIDLGEGDVLTLEPGVEVYALGKRHGDHGDHEGDSNRSKKGKEQGRPHRDREDRGDGGQIDIGQGAQLVCQGDALLIASARLVFEGAEEDGDDDSESEDDDSESEGDDSGSEGDDHEHDSASRVTCQGTLGLGSPRTRLEGHLEARALAAYAFDSAAQAEGDDREDHDLDDDHEGHEDKDHASHGCGQDHAHGSLEVGERATLVVAEGGLFGATWRIRFRNTSAASFGGGLHAEVASKTRGRLELSEDAALAVGGDLYLEAADVRLGARSVLRAGGEREVYSLRRFWLGADATFAAAPEGDPTRLTHPGGALTSLVYVMDETRGTEAKLKAGSTFVGCLQGTNATVEITGGEGDPP